MLGPGEERTVELLLYGGQVEGPRGRQPRPGEDQQVRVDDVGHDAHGHGQVFCRTLEKSGGSCVSTASSTDDSGELGGNGGVFSVDPGGAGKGGVGAGGVDDGFGACEDLGATPGATPAHGSFDVQAHVADLAGEPTGPVVRESVDEESGPQVCAHGNGGEDREAVGTSGPVLAECCRGRVVADDHGQSCGAFEFGLCGKVQPVPHGGLPGVGAVRCGDEADTEDPFTVDPGPVDEDVDLRGGTADDHGGVLVSRTGPGHPGDDGTGEVGEHVGDADGIEVHPDGVARGAVESEEDARFSTGGLGTSALQHESVVDEFADHGGDGGAGEPGGVDESGPADGSGRTDHVEDGGTARRVRDGPARTVQGNLRLSFPWKDGSRSRRNTLSDVDGISSKDAPSVPPAQPSCPDGHHLGLLWPSG